MNIKNLNKELSNFYIFMMGQFISQFGSSLTSFGLIFWSYKQSNSVFSMSLLSVCTLIPQVLLSFVAGTISDSWNKKKIMMISDSIAAIFSVIVIILLFMDILKVEYLYVINFIIGTSNAFQYPASDVTVSMIVSKENYMKTSGLRSLCSSFMGIFAPIIATSLYAFWGLKTIVMIDLATFIFAFSTLGFLVKVPQTPKALKKEKDRIWKQCLLGIGQNYYIWTIAVFLGNILIPFLTANVEYIMRTKVPIELQGRVFSARNTLQYTSIPIGNIFGGFLADKVFEPYMNKPALIQGFLTQIVGNTKGSGIALLFICLGIIGVLGCCIFRLSKSMRTLDYE